MIRFDPITHEVTLAVRDLIHFDTAPALRAEPQMRLRARAGSEAHRLHRQEAEAAGLPADYRSERVVEYHTERRGYRVAVQGRIDCLYREEGRWVVEEVKSVIFDPGRFAAGELERAVLEEGAYSDYRLQLEIYVLLLSETLAAEALGSPADPLPPRVIGRLVFRNLARKEELNAAVEVIPDLDRVRGWVESRLDAIIDRLEAEEAERAKRRAAAEAITFPFPELRPHQEDLIAEVESALSKGEHLLVSAPTGVGKTVAVLHAALRHALSNGLKVLYLTAKTTQQRIVAETLERIAAASRRPGGAGPPFRAVVLRAREKICPNLPEAGFIYCHEDFCRFARDYAAKVDAGGALGQLLECVVVRAEAAASLGARIEACPFELSVDAALLADVLVGDYNHVFDPGSHLRRFFEHQRSRDAILVIDEAHNLYQRGRESYSPGFARREVAALLRWAAGGGGEEPGSPAREALKGWCRRLEGLLGSLSAYGRDELGDPPIYRVELDPAAVGELSEELETIRTRHLVEGHLVAGKLRGGRAPAGPVVEDPLEAFAARWERFAGALSALEGAPHHVLYDKSDPGGHRLRILCLDPAAPLGRRMAKFHSVIALSATLEPLPFFRDVLGFPPERTRTVCLPSPFPRENRKVLVWDRVSTYFRSRSRDAAEIARLIGEITAVEPGNYLACFSSYAYLREVLSQLPPESRERCVVQTPGMTEAERDRVLALLKEPGSARTVFAVQGGIFSEGVDYPGSMLVGAIVIGPGLPAVTFDEELVREHFQDLYQEGFEYAYLYHGMNRVVQCAGRVIRSETDVGVIVLLGERFAQSQYSRLFPVGWYQGSPRELISTDLLGELREFWAGRRMVRS